MGPDFTTGSEIDPAIFGMAGSVSGSEDDENLGLGMADAAVGLTEVCKRTILSMSKDSEGLRLHLLDVKGRKSHPIDPITPIFGAVAPLTEFEDESGKVVSEGSEDDDSSILTSFDRPRSYCLTCKMVRQIDEDFHCTGCFGRYDACPADYKGSSPPTKFAIELVPARRHSDEEVCRTMGMRDLIRGSRETGFTFDPFHKADSFSAVAGINRTDDIEVTKFNEKWEMLQVYRVPDDLTRGSPQSPSKTDRLVIETYGQSTYALYCFWLELTRRRMEGLDEYFQIPETILNLSYDQLLIEYGIVVRRLAPFSIFLMLARLAVESRIKDER